MIHCYPCQKFLSRFTCVYTKRFHYPLLLTLPILCRGVCSTLSGVLAIPKTEQWGDLPPGAFFGHHLLGSSPGRIQGYPQDDGQGDKESKKKGRERGLIFLGLHRKPIKLLAWNLLCSRRPQAPSQWGEDAGCLLPGEDAGHLPNRVLEAQAKK